MDEQLTDRKKRILKAIIRTYMETGEPVGSRTISKDKDLNVSSATIRNEMSDLTDMGYIVQPHTSAGRIPSDKGYRLYVDELMREKEIATVPASAAAPAPAAPEKSDRQVAVEALGHYRKAQESLKQGNWTAYGDALKKMEDALRKLEKGR